MLTTHPHLAPKLMSGLVIPVYAFMVRTGVALPPSFPLLARLRAGRGGVHIPAEASDSSLQNGQTGSGTRLASYTMDAGGSC
jgi:hypothetical protein